jgi:hypothetical protein
MSEELENAVTEEEYLKATHPSEQKVEVPDTPLKKMIVDYVGNKFYSEETIELAEVTLQMILDVFADEFPEMILPLAEENWARGYEQGVQDVISNVGISGEQKE